MTRSALTGTSTRAAERTYSHVLDAAVDQRVCSSGMLAAAGALKFCAETLKLVRAPSRLSTATRRVELTRNAAGALLLPTLALAHMRAHLGCVWVW